MRMEDLTGKQFGLLTVLKFSHIKELPKNGKTYYWDCVCSCGKTTKVSRSHLIGKKTKSCGHLKAYKALDSGLASFNDLYRHYKYVAKKKEFPFEFTQEEFKLITSSDCFYCGTKPIQKHIIRCSPTYYTYNGIDRKDNKIGYTKENCVPACKYCNYAKHHETYNDFLNWIKRLVNFQNGKNI